MCVSFAVVFGLFFFYPLVLVFMQVKKCLYHHDWHSKESKFNLST